MKSRLVREEGADVESATSTHTRSPGRLFLSLYHTLLAPSCERVSDEQGDIIMNKHSKKLKVSKPLRRRTDVMEMKRRMRRRRSGMKEGQFERFFF